MFTLFNCRKKQLRTAVIASEAKQSSAAALQHVSSVITNEAKQSSTTLQHAPLTKLNSSLGAHVYSFLSGREALNAKLTSKQFNTWDNDDKNNHIWREHLKNDFGCHQNFVIHLTNAKQVYLRIYHLKNNPSYPFRITEEIDYFVLKAESGYTKNLELSDEISIEKCRAYLWSAAAVGDVELIRRLIAKYGETLRDNNSFNTLIAACIGGHQNILYWVIDESYKAHGDYGANWVFQTVARSGELPLLKLLISEYAAGKLRFHMDWFHAKCLLEEAVKSGNSTLVKWLMTEALKNYTYKLEISTLACAARSGRFNLVRWLMSETSIKTEWSFWSKLGTYLTQHGTWKAMWEIQWEKPWLDTLLNASSSGNFKLVFFVLKHLPADIKLPEDFASHAAIDSAGSGNIALTLWWMLKMPKSDYPYYLDSILISAIKSQNIELVKKLIDPAGRWRIEPNNYTFNCAIQTGNIAIVQSILEIPNFNWQPDSKTLIFAAKTKNFALIEWLTNPERGPHQLHVSEEMIDDAIKKYTSLPEGSPDRESRLFAQKTLALLDQARTLVTPKSSFVYRSPAP